MFVEIEDPQKRSRLLYTNPVCLFTTKPKGAPPNVMTISWLTPVDNQGNFIFSMNQRRATASILPLCKKFVLSVPVRGMEDLVLRIGNTHGNDKVNRMTIPTCRPGSDAAAEEDLERVIISKEEDEELVAVRGCAAHMICSVVSVDGDAVEEHNLTICKIEKAWVRSDYWNGKNFVAQNDTVPPYLSFLGSQSFAYVQK